MATSLHDHASPSAAKAAVNEHKKLRGRGGGEEDFGARFASRKHCMHPCHTLLATGKTIALSCHRTLPEDGEGKQEEETVDESGTQKTNKKSPVDDRFCPLHVILHAWPGQRYDHPLYAKHRLLTHTCISAAAMPNMKATVMIGQSGMESWRRCHTVLLWTPFCWHTSTLSSVDVSIPRAEKRYQAYTRAHLACASPHISIYV
eukprot:1161352-Pelagomonas_calceolata.AAC.18